jgi:hypothetical protein
MMLPTFAALRNNSVAGNDSEWIPEVEVDERAVGWAREWMDFRSKKNIFLERRAYDHW